MKTRPTSTARQEENDQNLAEPAMTLAAHTRFVGEGCAGDG
ncbi:hypothetical protein [Xanthomonas fragariae]|nr:hypothetical protein [Xanthomonas fragariae]